MTTVRTVTTVTKETTSGSIGQSPQIDNTLESLLEDLQTSVNTRSPVIQAPPPMVNGVTAYSVEEVTSTIEKDGVRSPEKREYRVHYITPANPTTVISESDIKYKHTQNLNESDAKLKQDLKESDAKLKQNLNELDNLLVDLRKVQKAGFSVPSTRSGIDPSLLEPVEHTVHTTPRQPTEPIPKRSSSVQKELLYGTIESGHVRTGRSPSPATPQRNTARRDVSTTGSSRYRDKSPTNRRLQRELLDNDDFPNVVNSYSFTASEPLGRRSPSPSHMITGGKKITTRTYNYSSNTSSPYPDRNYDRKRSPSPTLNYPQSSVHTYSSNVSGSSSQPYPDSFEPKRSVSPSPGYSTSAPPGSSKITTVRTYNYTTNTSDTSQPYSVSYEPKQSPSPTLAYPSHTPPGSTKIIRTYNYSTDSNVSKYPDSHHPNFEVKRSPSPSPIYPTSPSQPGIIKKETTVHTYNYSSNTPGSSVSYPENYDQKQPPSQPKTTHTYTYDHQSHPDDKPLSYHVSPPRDGPSNVITYKYTTHHTAHNKYPGHHPDVTQPLLPRPFPIDDSTDGNPPKALDDLMASFTDTEIINEHHVQKHEPQVKKSSSNVPDGGAAILPVIPAPVTPAPQPKVLSKNVEGPPVYYPPGVDMFAKKEDPGSMQKASTKANKYEAANEKASKGASGGAGAAIVPIPLCCGMACTIL